MASPKPRPSALRSAPQAEGPQPYKPKLPPAVEQHLAAAVATHRGITARQNRGERGAPSWEMTEPLDVIRREIELGGDALHRHPTDKAMAEVLAHLANALTALSTAYTGKVARDAERIAA